MAPLAISRLPSPPALISGGIVAAIIGPSEESGPSTRIRDGPAAAAWPGALSWVIVQTCQGS